jgi:acetyl esterase/lipase
VPVHPLIAARFPLIQELVPGADPAEAPESALAWFAPYGEYALPDVEIEERTASGPHGPVLLRVYRPRDLAAGAPGLVWAHGGGFMSGDLDMPEAHVVAAELAARAGAVVASVEYRLATPTVHHPVPVDDLEAAWHAFLGDAEELGVDPAGVAIGGASAGANLAAAVVLRLRDAGAPPAALLLAYPAMHFPNPALEGPVAAEMPDLPPTLRFPASSVTQIFRAYFGRITDIPAESSPGLADLTGFPPTRIVLSEYDDLRASGELWIEQLEERGIPVTAMVAAGMLHGHLNIPPVAELPEIGRSLAFLAEGL